MLQLILADLCCLTIIVTAAAVIKICGMNIIRSFHPVIPINETVDAIIDNTYGLSLIHI